MFITFQRHLLAALLIPLALAAFPTLTFATHSWGGYHWARTTASFSLKLGDNVSSAWDSYLATASSDWTFSSVLDTTVVAGNAGSNLRKCPPTSGRVEVCSYTYGTNGWLGVASIWISGLHITQGTVKMNDSYFNNPKYQYNTPAWRRLVMCQEVGHTFGLDHQDETFGNANLGTCMDYTNDPDGGGSYGLSNEHPNQHDYDEMGIIYLHLDSAATVKQSVTNRPAAANNDEPAQFGTAQWGKLVRSTNHGRTELYDLDLGRGRKVLTQVIWADPEE
jgi:hypothetical protein